MKDVARTEPMATFTASAARCFASAYDDPDGVYPYAEYCDIVGRVAMWISDAVEAPVVFVDSSNCRQRFSPLAIDRLAQLAQRHGAEPDCELGDQCIFSFRQVDHAVAFATAAADWLRQSGQFEPPKPTRQHVGPVVEYSEFYNRSGH
jgi:hypothetical protein